MTTLARISALLGGIVLTTLAILVTISVLGGALAKFSYSDFAAQYIPSLATWLQGTGVRSVPAIYEIMTIGIAFVIFAFLPIASLYQGHAVVDIFTSFLPAKLNQFLIAFWETVFFLIFLLITWRLYFGMTRLMKSGQVLTELAIPEWWGYGVAFVQLLVTCLVAGFTALAAWQTLITGREVLPNIKGAQH